MSGSRMYSWMNPKLEIRQTGRYGRGVFATGAIARDDVLFVMGGYILTTEEDNEIQGDLADKGIEISEKFIIGPRSPEDLDLMPQHFVNHSCDPTAGFRGQIFMTAMRDLQAGDEVCYDYAMVMCPDPESNSYFRMECRCGSARCRGVVTEDDWELRDLQQRYEGCFQGYLEEKIRQRRREEREPRIDRSYRDLPPPWRKR